MELSPRVSNARRRILIAGAALPALGFAQLPQAQPVVSAEGPVRAILRSHKKWVFAHTSRKPLDPLEVWNRYPATVDMDGDQVRLVTSPALHDTPSVFPLDIQPGGFTFDWTGHAFFFMRLDTADPKAPFKGETGVMTIWLLPVQ